MQAKLIITFGPLANAAFLTKAGTIVNALRNNPNFPEPWPPQVPALSQLNDAYEAYQSAFRAAENGDRARITEREATRAVLVSQLKILAAYLELVAQGDTTKLMSTGFDLRKDIVRGTRTDPLLAPMGFSARHGKLSGVVILHATRLSGAASYEAQYTDGDPKVESDWKNAGTYPGCNHIEITGLAIGKNHWFRIRGIDSNGPGKWTEPVSLIVI